MAIILMLNKKNICQNVFQLNMLQCILPKGNLIQCYSFKHLIRFNKADYYGPPIFLVREIYRHLLSSSQA